MKQNLIIINTGNGKGKTTAALGQLWRALGHGLNCGVIQFIKQYPQQFGEYMFACSAQVEWTAFGEGFLWEQSSLTSSRERSRNGWEYAKEKILEGRYNMLLLDEFTFPINHKWIAEEEVITWITEHRDIIPHLIITGRKASRGLISIGDIVTEMKEVKHCFSQQGIAAQKGIEY